MAEEFTCDNCGLQFPKERMKEAVFQAAKGATVSSFVLRAWTRQ